MNNKNKKIILITGTSSGIGRETAVRLAKEGHKVFAGVRRKVDKQELEKLNPNITGVYIDITNPASIDKAFWFVLKNTKKLDVLINNAGIVIAGPIELLDIKKLKEQFDVNTFGAIAVTQKFMPLLKDGKVINISSMASHGTFPYISPYCASKRAMDILFNSFALENKDNIKVISIKPASIKTPIWNKSVKKAHENLSTINDAAIGKYYNEISYLERNALQNNKKGIEIYKVVDKILEVISKKNPKSTYNVGLKANLFDLFCKFIPEKTRNSIIKFNLNRIK
ncbi:MAG: SDR family oxidoreductase [Candidatus Gastranaerophilales bacterium]|nr:SDR family oxidoreductase [Candidatus Gastranaerophilales bacterium]